MTSAVAEGLCEQDLVELVTRNCRQTPVSVLFSQSLQDSSQVQNASQLLPATPILDVCLV